MDFNKEIQNATIKNLASKSKIMAFVFLFILILQITSVTVIFIKTDFFTGIKTFVPLLGLLMMLTACYVEWIAFKYLNRIVDEGREINRSLPYVITVIEISFPTFVLLFGGWMMTYLEYDFRLQLLSSAPAVMYFLMIILSSLMLNRRICIVAGIIATIEYVFVASYLLKDSTNFEIDFPTQASKGIVFLLGGIVAGYVAIKIKESLIDSMKAKDTLISKLDGMVKEKTQEITLKNEELEAKNKDITDSIHYAKRIQDAQMPKEKFVARIIGKLKGK